MRKWIILSVILGFIGAAAFYSPHIGINGQLGIECPPCPHVMALWRSQTEAFVRLTLAGGVLNTIFFGSLIVLAMGFVQAFKWAMRAGRRQ